MRRFLFIWVFLLTACTFVSEPIAVTRELVATVVALTTATPSPPLPTATVIPTVQQLQN